MTDWDNFIHRRKLNEFNRTNVSTLPKVGQWFVYGEIAEQCVKVWGKFDPQFEIIIWKPEIYNICLSITELKPLTYYEAGYLDGKLGYPANKDIDVVLHLPEYGLGYCDARDEDDYRIIL